MTAIFVLLTFVAFLCVDALFELRKAKQRAQEGVIARAQVANRPIESEFVLPGGLFVHPGHAWAQVAASGAVRVGFDDLVCQALGRGDRLVLLSPGDRVTQGEPMVVLEQGHRGIALSAPVSGEIVEVNPALREIPKSLDVSPYEGWVYALKPSRLGEEISRLKLAETAEAWLHDQFRLFSDWVRTRAGLVAQPALADGGLPVRGCLAYLDDAAWEEFQREFLGVHEPVAQPSSDERRRP